MPKSEKIWRVLASLIVFYILLYLFATNSLNIQGFGPYDSDRGVARPATVWDWLQLLIIPIVLALAAWRLEAAERKADRQLADKRADLDREFADRRAQTDHEIAEKRARTDHEIALDRQQQATLETYYDRMADLLLKENLRESKPKGEVRSIARARTLAVLRALDETRKAQVVQFLYESHLIDAASPIIDLKNADLREIDLFRTDLPGICLSHAHLFFADLSEADLSSANLSGAGFLKADLAGIRLSHADLSDVSFPGVDLCGADLFHADLFNANLSAADLSVANLSGANLNGTILFDTNLSGTNLTNAIYTKYTRWPEDFDPESHGAILVDNNGEPLSPPS
ncbi:MAG: pentapeptide repeat-containing protein [Anaerolineae bacterium]|nr:pentapeptide repeat-containing protein [Anaerolineae bacterium]